MFLTKGLTRIQENDHDDGGDDHGDGDGAADVEEEEEEQEEEEERGVRRDLVLHHEPYVAALALLQERPRVLEDGRLRNLCSNGWRWC